MQSANELPSSRTAIRLAAAVAFALILIGGFEPFYLRIFMIDRAREGAIFAELPFQKMPGLKSFLEGVNAHTRPRTRIAIWVPFRRWEGGYRYAYSRASYLLAGKELVSLLALHEDRVVFSNLAQADYLASYVERIDAPGFETCWQDAHGVLLKASRPVAPNANAR